ncbi:uncharacterized protein LOC141535921 [Cotesia typhae]|uniref:uncharacterized protein LOC141535921 n=1 Tax=Cotesia typhae TaxID=2053667 RepID=UPI003D69B15B
MGAGFEQHLQVLCHLKPGRHLRSRASQTDTNITKYKQSSQKVTIIKSSQPEQLPAQANQSSQIIDISKSSQPEQLPAQANAITLSAINTRTAVILATCKALVVSPNMKKHTTRLLIDPGSELTLVSAKLVKEAKLNQLAAVIPILGVGNQSSSKTLGQTNLTIESCISHKQVHLRAHILPQITTKIPTVSITDQHWSHLSKLERADPDFLKPGHVEILIGADTLNQILEPSPIIKGQSDEPLAIHTIFGWAFLGPASSQARNLPLRSLHTVPNGELQDSLRRFWVQEEVPNQTKPSLSLAEAQCEEYYVSTLSRNQEGRYVVRIPLSTEISQLGDSRAIAYRCLKRLLKRLESDGLLKQRYIDFMHEYETLGHMVAVPKDTPEPKQVYYLPHHRVL